MRVGFNGFGQLGVYRAGMGALGACTFDPQSGESLCSDPAPTPASTDCPGGGYFDGVNCMSAGGDILGAPGSGGTGSGTAAPVNPNETYQTPSDGVSITGCSQYDAYGNCVTCGAGTKLNSWGGAYTSCDSIGGLPGAKKPVVQPNAFSQILNSIFGAPRPLTASSAGACAAAGGTWNGVTCTPKGTVNLGGVALSTSTLLIGGVVLIFLMKGKR